MSPSPQLLLMLLSLHLSPRTPPPPLKEKKASQKMEIVLATLSMPAKEDLKGKGLESLTAAPTQSTKAPTEDKLVIKIK